MEHANARENGMEMVVKRNAAWLNFKSNVLMNAWDMGSVTIRQDFAFVKLDLVDLTALSLRQMKLMKMPQYWRLASEFHYLAYCHR